MKKSLATILLLGMCLALVACGKKENPLTGYKSGDVTLGQYKGLTYKPDDVSVTDEDVQSYITSNLLSAHREKQSVDGRDVVEQGDTIVFDYEGIKDGVAFEGGTAKDATLTIGSGQFIPGFEEAIVGKKIDEPFSFDITFPEGYSEELGGKETTFNCTVHEIYVMVNPEFTDELVAENTDYKTVDEYTEYAKKQVQSQKDSNAQNSKQSAIFNAAISNATFNKDFSKEIETAKENLTASYNTMYQSYYGVDAATFYNYVYGMTAEQFEEYMESLANTQVKFSYLLSAVAETENIVPTAGDVSYAKMELLNSYNLSSEDDLYKKLKELYNADGKTVVEEQARINLARELILDNAVAE